MEIVAQRQFGTTYIILDLIFLLLLLLLLLWQKKYMTVLVGAAAGILYMLVDYGIFHLLCHTRSISQGHSLFWVLLWMSMSYGFTNFTWIWLWISRDRNLKEWSLLILLWWFCCPLMAASFGSGDDMITIQRTTGAYHGYMAVLLFIGYLGVILWNLRHERKRQRIPVGWLLGIGILVQFGWEAALLLGGIRSAAIPSWDEKWMTLIVNSLLETNLGIPYVYVLYLLYTSRFTEQLHRREQRLSFMEALEENNDKSNKNIHIRRITNE